MVINRPKFGWAALVITLMVLGLILGGCSQTTIEEKLNPVKDPVDTGDTQKAAIPSAAEETAPEQPVKDSFDVLADAKYVGRFDFTNPIGPVFAWSGSSISTRFTGTSIQMKIMVRANQINNWVNVIVDDREPVPLHINFSGVYPLASDLSGDVHTIEIVKRTEASLGELQFIGFELPEGGEFLSPPLPAERRIEFIGDSITCGYGNEAQGAEDGFKPEQENSYLTYNAITARNLGADQITLAWSGKGMYQNYGGNRGEQMPDIYLRTLPSRKDSLWDFDTWTPDVVVINLGTNDFSVDTLDTQAYSTAYKEFLTSLRSRYPKADIFCTIGPMNQKPARFIESVVQEFNTVGDNHVYFLEFSPQNIQVNGLGGDWHPSLKTHKVMAEELTRAIEDKLGWGRFSTIPH